MLIKKMSEQECRETLARLSLGRLGCARDNQPYIVPIYFVCDKDGLYGFATFGQKIEWMRLNPKVCVQADEVRGNDNWTSVAVQGRYEELTDTAEYGKERAKAQSLLQARATWWQTAYVASNIRNSADVASPVYFRIRIEGLSGLSASPEGSPVRVR